jgi:hypothetical protein
VKYFKENIGSVEVHLSKEELAEVRKLGDNYAVAGNRYPDAFMATLNK